MHNLKFPVTLNDVNLVIISVNYRLVYYSSPKHHDITITSSHYHIVNMDVIQTSLRPMCIHLYLLSVLKVPIALGCTLRVSTSKIKSILGEIPEIILRVHTNTYLRKRWRDMHINWIVDVLVCRRFGLSTFGHADVLICRRFGLSTFGYVDVLVCRRFGLSTFRLVDVSVCRRVGLSTFCLSTFRFFDILTSYLQKSAL